MLLALVGGGIDYAHLVSRRSQLQGAVDAAVLTGANALKLAGADLNAVSNITERTIRDIARANDDKALVIKTEISKDQDSVFASAQEVIKLFFGNFIGVKLSTISVRAKANIVGKMRLCLLSTDVKAVGSIDLFSDSRITANGCSIYTNSTDQRALVGYENAMAQAESICSAGGFDGSRANFSPAPKTGCPSLQDPLKGRIGPMAGSCANIPPSSDAGAYLESMGFHLHDHSALYSNNTSNFLGSNSINQNTSTNYNISNKIARSTTLEPGTYCGGLLITGSATVNLRPGTYVIKDGPLLVDKEASLLGVDVSIYFTGEAAGLLFNTNTSISLSAPAYGQMAGILLSDDGNVSRPVDPALYLNAWNNSLSGFHNCPLTSPPVSLTPPALGQSSPMRTYRVISNNTRKMLGTIHLPAGRIVFDGNRPVADQSDYTVIIAKQVNLYKGPNLVLNANYERSSIPVPKGVGPIAGRISLTQ